jgi:DHA2 family multidrug resistance protein-like MFS transporter
MAPVLARRVQPAFLVAAGLALAAASFGLLTQVGISSLAFIVIAWSTMSLGFGMTFTLTTDLVVGSAPAERAGAASAISETAAELGGALGIAVLGSLGTALYRSQVAAAIPPSLPPEAAKTAQETLAGAVAVAGQLPDQLSSTLLNAAYEAFIQGLQLTSVIGVVVMIGLAILTATMLREAGTEAEPEQQPDQEPVGRAVASTTQPDLCVVD